MWTRSYCRFVATHQDDGRSKDEDQDQDRELLHEIDSRHWVIDSPLTEIGSYPFSIGRV